MAPKVGRNKRYRDSNLTLSEWTSLKLDFWCFYFNRLRMKSPQKKYKIRTRKSFCDVLIITSESKWSLCNCIKVLYDWRKAWVDFADWKITWSVLIPINIQSCVTYPYLPQLFKIRPLRSVSVFDFLLDFSWKFSPTFFSQYSDFSYGFRDTRELKGTTSQLIVFFCLILKCLLIWFFI